MAKALADVVRLIRYKGSEVPRNPFVIGDLMTRSYDRCPKAHRSEAILRKGASGFSHGNTGMSAGDIKQGWD